MEFGTLLGHPNAHQPLKVVFFFQRETGSVAMVVGCVPHFHCLRAGGLINGEGLKHPNPGKANPERRTQPVWRRKG